MAKDRLEDFVPVVRHYGLKTGKNVEMTGNLTVGGTMSVTGAQTFTGNTTISGNLAVTGTALFDRVVTAVTAATLAPAVADSGTLYALNRAAGIAVSLPSPAAGMWYEFFFLASVTSNTTTFTALTGDLLYGGVVAVDTDSSDAVVHDDPDMTDDLIATFNGSTQGGLVGTRLKFTAINNVAWLVEGVNRHSGNFATIFS